MWRWLLKFCCFKGMHYKIPMNVSRYTHVVALESVSNAIMNGSRENCCCGVHSVNVV